MKFKKIMMPIVLITTVAPVAAIVSCNGSDSDNTDTPNSQTGIEKATALEKQIGDLTKQLEVEKNRVLAANEQSNNQVINDLSHQISDLKTQLSTISTALEQVQDQVKQEPKHLTLEERKQSFQIFLAQNQKDLKALSFEELNTNFNPEVQWQRGISTFALAQGGSYFYNLALKLGYQKQIQDIQNLAIKTPSVDVELNAQRDEVYNQLKNIFDNVKSIDSKQKAALLASQDFQKFNFNTSNGGHLSQQRLVHAGLDISGFGQASNPSGYVPKGKTDNKAFDYANFTYTSADGTKNTLIGDSNKLKGMKYWNGDIPGTNVIRIDIPATFTKDASGDATAIPLTNAFSREYVVEGMQPIYPKETDTDKNHNLLVLEGLVRKLSIIFSEENKAAVDQLKSIAELFSVSKEFIGALEFLGRQFDTANGFTLADVEKAYDSLNNGSHYFKAVETFIRGVEGVSFGKASKQGILPDAPTVDASDYAHDGIINASLDHLEATLDSWSGQQGQGAYIFKEGKFIIKPIKNFN